jgi:hypothetical protein
VFDMERLRQLSAAERLELMRALAALDRSETDPDPAASRRRALVLTTVIICCVVLAAWIGVLAVTLPPYYRTGAWRGAWVGFDLALLGAFAATGWAAWRRRQILIVCLIVLATLLCCDAWFDVLLDARTKGFELSLLSAVLIELPLAALAALGARRLLHLSIAAVRRYEGQPGPHPSLRQVGIIGGRPDSHLSDLFTEADPAPGAGQAHHHVRASPADGDPVRDGQARDRSSGDTPARDRPARDSPARDSPARDSPARDSHHDSPADAGGAARDGQVRNRSERDSPAR